MKKHIGTAAAFLATTTFAWADSVAPGEVAFVDGAIEASLTGTPGDPAAGQVVMNKGSGNCIACHMVSQLEDIYPFHGEVGPPLDGAADRWTEAELRGIVTNAKMMFEGSMMPSFYKTTGHIRPGDGYTGKAAKEPIMPILTAQQIEDVVAFLMTLHDE